MGRTETLAERLLKAIEPLLVTKKEALYLSGIGHEVRWEEGCGWIVVDPAAKADLPKDCQPSLESGHPAPEGC